MVLSTLALVGIIQLFLLLAGGIFFLFLHTRFLKKQIRELRGENQNESEVPPPAVAAMTESSETESSKDLTESVEPGISEPSPSGNSQSQPADTEKPASSAAQMEGKGYLPVAPELAEEDAVKVTGEIAELRKMLNEKLLLTANMRKLIEGLLEDTGNAENIENIATQQNSSLLHLEEYIKLSRKEAAAVEEKITHYREQLAKAKKILNRYKEQHEHDLKQLEEEQKAHDTQAVAKAPAISTPPDADTEKAKETKPEAMPQADEADKTETSGPEGPKPESPKPD